MVTAALNMVRKTGCKIQRGAPRLLTCEEIHRCSDQISSGRECRLVLESSPGYERPRAISRPGEIALEKVPNYPCPRCGQPQLNVYYSDKADSRVGAWCEYCNLKAYYDGEQLVPIGS